MGLQETRAALAEVTEMTQRQKACIAALNKERAELAARSADPAQVAALRTEAAQLQERLRSFTAVKVRMIPPGVTESTRVVHHLVQYMIACCCV